MKKTPLTGTIVILLLVIGYISAQAKGPMTSTFEGITPCDGTVRPIPQIPAGTTCEEMIWKIIFTLNPEAAEPQTYQLHAAYGMSQPNTTGLKDGGTPIDLEGTWRIIESTAEGEDVTVYELNPETPESAIYLLKLDANILHVLSSDRRLLVGNGAWSYTLNRTDKHAEIQPVSPSPEQESSLNETSTAGVFDGRMPCDDLVLEFTKYTAAPRCRIIKMRLTLYRDAKTGQPTTYLLNGSRTSLEATWTETYDAPAYPNMPVYRLSLENPQRFTAFLRVDDNHLYMLDENLHLMVGDKLWSFTLSRNIELSGKMN